MGRSEGSIKFLKASNGKTGRDRFRYGQMMAKEVASKQLDDLDDRLRHLEFSNAVGPRLALAKSI